MLFMGPGLTVIVTANIVLTTLGLFEHKVLYDARNNTLRLIESGNGRTDLGKYLLVRTCTSHIHATSISLT